MIDVVEEFGLNAGRVWMALNKCGPLTEQQLMEETSLRKVELSAAIGWLSRENKVCKDGDFFKLDQTNMTIQIGGNAGKVWKLLSGMDKEVNTTYISKMLNIDVDDTFSALGWLAREGKIDFKKGN
jgi:hypothetical protein